MSAVDEALSIFKDAVAELEPEDQAAIARCYDAIKHTMLAYPATISYAALALHSLELEAKL